MIGNASYIYLKNIIETFEIIKGTSPGGNISNTIILDSLASSVNGAYDPGIVVIYDGTGFGQSRQVWDYDGAAKKCILNRDWKVIPDSTSKYKILYNPGNTHVNEGMATGGGSNTIILNTLASNQNNIYLGQIIFITSGTGTDQARMIVGYNGTTKTATVDANWIVQPDNTSVYAIYPFPGFVHGRPPPNSTDNLLIRDVIGNKTDLVTVPYAENNSIAAFLHTGYYHVHGASFLYPDLAAPVTLTSGTASWSDPGSFTEIIPADTITKNFDIHWASLSNISATLDGVIKFYSGDSGSEELIGSVDVVRTSNFSREAPGPVQVPQQPANSRISAKFFDSTGSARTARVKLYGHVYSDSLT